MRSESCHFALACLLAAPFCAAQESEPADLLHGYGDNEYDWRMQGRAKLICISTRLPGWVGVSSAPNPRAPTELVPDPGAAKIQPKLLWLSCGNKDGLIRISQGMQR